MLQFFEQAKKHLTNDAIIHDGVIYKYEQLIASAEKFTGILLNNTPDLNQARVAFMVPPGFDYVKTLWAIWIAGGVAVPLCITHPLPSLEYVLDDTQSSILVISQEFKEVLAPYLQNATIRVIIMEDVNEEQIAFLRNRQIERLKALFAFIKEKDKCRNQILLPYFGEEKNAACMHCDICESVRKMNIQKRISSYSMRTF